MKTILGKEIPESTRGVLYLCKYTYDPPSIKVKDEGFYLSPFGALDAYSNIPNPESQLATGETYEDLIADLKLLHIRMSDPGWLKDLGDAL